MTSRILSCSAALLLFLALSAASLYAADTRGLRVVAKDPATNETAEVKLYNKSYAVVIGIDRYQNLSADRQLQNAVKDAKGVAEVLKKNYRFDRIYSLYNQEATKERILELLTEELPKGMGEEDSVFIFWAGHGNQESSAEGDIGYLIPYDGSTDKIRRNITMTEIRDTISKKIPAKHIFYVMDACYSGLLASRAVDNKTRRDLKYLRSITRERARQVLTAGGKGEEVLDGGPKGHSVFTGRLIEALEAAGDFITANEIQAILKEKVYGDALGRGKAQTPGFGVLSGSGDFVFIPNIQQQAADTKATIAQLEKEQAELEARSAAAIRANDEKQRQEAELARKSGEARLKAAQLRKQQLALEERKRSEDEQERLRLAQAKAADEQRLAKLKDDVAKKRQQVQSSASTDNLEAAVAEIKRLNNRINEIETEFASSLDATRQQTASRYSAKLAELDRQKKDEFESSSDFRNRISREKQQLASQRDSELSALTPQNAAARETAPLKEAIRKLSEKQFTVSSGHITMELGSYDAEKEFFPVTLQSRSSLVKLAVNGTIPLPKEKARNFKQQYSAGAIRPVAIVSAGSGETRQVALVNDADSAKLPLENGEFVTSERKQQVEALTAERERLIYTDPQTGLMWARNGNIAGKEMVWQDAMTWAQNLNYAGYSDWRLPTKEELAAFAKRGGNRPSERLNSNGFSNVQAGWYWSSTTNDGYLNDAWSVYMGDGHVSDYDKDGNNYVWPVRSGQF